MDLYSELLKTWCDSLLELQVTQIEYGGIYGGIICPACSKIHGRCADAVYPLMHMAHKSGESKYLEAAIRLQAWAEHVSLPDGSWLNEVDNTWTGTTVFGTIALGEALRNHGEILDRSIQEEWMFRLKKSASFIYDTFTMSTGNINYPISAAAALTIAGIVLMDERFLLKGREFAKLSRGYFSENMLIFGEGHPQKGYTKRGCRAVDLAYNVEESLPALVMYGKLAKDEELLEFVARSMREHLEFMLPDGGWDGSFSSRNYKWSYWGGRTSDGCQGAFGLMADRDPVFAEAVYRNTRLLKFCTHNGLLHGGPHYIIKGELPCIQHTIGHGKALTAMLDHSNTNIVLESFTPLPRELATGVKEYPEIATWLAALGPWKGTVTAYDWEYIKEGHPSGGALSLLWHRELGPVFAGSMTKYRMYEGSNMQRDRDEVSMALTPRLELCQEGKCYCNINDYEVKVEYTSRSEEIRFNVSGKLVDGDQLEPPTGPIESNVEYIIRENSVVIKAAIKGYSGKLKFYFPVISSREEKVDFNNANSIFVSKKGLKLKIVASSKLNCLKCDNNRIFNHVPGFEALPLFVEMDEINKAAIEISTLK